MKKLFNLVFVFFFSFVFITLRVGAIPEACDSKINTETYYNESGWDTYVYVCNSQFSGRYNFSTCVDSIDEAKNYCKGTFSQSTYKGSYQTATYGECSEQLVESCFKCTVECYKPTGSYYECSSSDSYSYSSYDGAAGKLKYYCASYSWQEAEPITYSNDDEGLTPDDKSTYVEKVKVDKCGGYQSRNAKCENQYRVKIPLYTCVNPPKKYQVKNMREAKYTVKTSHGTTIPAYCINPDDEAPDMGSLNNAMAYTVDATSCASSFATTDCGYANILIEGYYRGTLKGNSKYTYAVIGDAMRLWGAHWGAGGYEDTGIADEDDTTISDANKWLKFVPQENGQYLNVFKETVAAVMKQELYRPSTDDIYDVKTDFDATLNLQQIACSSSRMGLFCGQGSKDGYLYAIALFANTVQGNKYMQQHLNEINAHLYGDDIFVDNNPEGAMFKIIDENTIRITYTRKEGVEITCDKLDPNSEVAKRCKSEQKIVIKTSSGEIVKEIDSYDYCDKNYCYVDIEVVPGTVKCNILEGVDIKVKRLKKCGAESVKKYVSCGSMTNTQIMFSFEPDQTCNEGPEYESLPWVDIDCPFDEDCPDGPKATTPNCDIDRTDQDYVSREVSDPSLNCILHKRTEINNGTQSVGRRNYYDYSDMFGVNTNFCKVYCSDKVTYYMEGRRDVYSALQLKYDIESKVFPSRPNSEKSSHALTSIIKVQRDCVSEIYYDNINFSIVDQVGKDYGLDGNISNWKQLYQLLKEKSMTENNRQEVLNQLIYDLYACNFFSDTQISNKTSNKVKKPKDSKNPLSIANTILTNTQNYCNGTDCVSGKIQYKGGAEYINSADTYRYTGLNWSDPALSTEEIVNNGLNVRYCNESECFRGKIDNSFKEDYGSAHTSSFRDAVSFNGTNVLVPTNDYAIFTYTMEADLYNSTRYQTEPYSGKVSVVENNTFDDKLQTLDKYLYPIAKSANTVCTKKSDSLYLCDVNYDIDVSVITKYNDLLNAEKDQIGTIAFRRKNNSAYNDLIELLSKPDTRKYSCVYGINKKVDNAFVFRNIDLNNPVPVERDGTKLDNSNWDKNNPDDPEYSTFINGVINEIKTSGQEQLYATDYYLEYSYELTPDAIRSIRSHNENSEYYEDVIPGSCTMSDGKNFNCKSLFLQDLHAGRFGVTLKKTDGQSKYNVCKDNPSEEGCVD